MSKTVMPQINKVVLLMLENRSLDNVLGWLYDGVELPADRVYPSDSSRGFDGITSYLENGVGDHVYKPSRGTQQRFQPLRQPRWNPNEWWANVGNQCYWDAHGHEAIARWTAGSTAPMTGFAKDYAAFYDSTGEVMGAYSKDQLPVLYGLAEGFAVSDRWFSSVPTETNPNRAFGLCGTSQGAVDNADRMYYTTPTLLNALSSAPEPKSWKVYWQYNGSEDMDPDKNDPICYTVDVFQQIRVAVNEDRGRAACLEQFFADAAAGELPDVSYIEPFSTGGYGFPWGDDFIGLQGNDYHAPGWVGQAEWDLNRVYQALIDSPHWDETLLVITFDEHGGTWDHVPPQSALNPDKWPPLQPFDFNFTGVRVPAILVSPWVKPGSVFRAPTGSPYPFDHTSVIATLLRWAGIEDLTTTGFGRRVAAAPSFHEVVGPTYHDNTPEFTVPVSYQTMGGPKGPHNIPFGIGKMKPHDFRRIEAQSSSHRDFLHRLRREAANDGRNALERAADFVRSEALLAWKWATRPRASKTRAAEPEGP